MWRLDLRNDLNTSIAAFVVALAMLGIAAQPASAAFREVSPTGSDVGNDCLSAPCATIQHAIEEAKNGDWVDVRAGTYVENVTIDKPLTLLGPNGNAVPGEPQAIVDGGSGTAIKPESHWITIRGMTATAGATGTAIRTAGADVDKLQIQEDIITGGSSGVDLEAGGEEILVGYNLIEEVGDGIQLSGTAYTGLSIRWNRFVEPIGEYTVLGGNGTTIEGFTLEGNEMPAPTRIAARITKRQGEENDLTENSFYSTGGPQLAIDGHDVRLMENSFEGHGSTACLQILGSQSGLTPSDKVLVSGNEFSDCNPYGIEVGPEVNAINVRSNEFAGSYDGITTSNASPWSVTGHVQVSVNRIVGTTHLGVDNTVSGTLDAEQNWWGCNAGPGPAGCDGVSGGVDAADNITLDALIGPRKKETGIEELPTGTSITLNPGEQAEVAALLSAGGSEPNLGVPADKAQIGFSSSLGTLSPATANLQNGWTKAIFTAGAAPGQGWIVVSMDNQQTLVPVTIPGGITGIPPAMPTKTPRGPTIVASGKRHLRAGRLATIGTVSCTDSCRVAPSRVRIVIGHHRYQGSVAPRGALAAESTTPIRVALSLPALRALKELGSARIRVTVTVVDAAGQTATRTISVRVQP
jgi:nitrous oxidase accessory protein NosD